jgi:uncharacterized protein YaiI (UPF0178 family)
MVDMFVDVESCAVYPEMIRLAQLHSIDLYVVTRDYLESEAPVHLILADDGSGGREWIAVNIAKHDICVTDDQTLAMRCILRGAVALKPSGHAWTGTQADSGAAFRENPESGAKSLAQHLGMAIAEARRSSRLRHLVVQRLVVKDPPVAHPRQVERPIASIEKKLA